MNDQIGVMVVHERRWTRQRFDQHVAERKAESKVRGGTEEGREATFVHMAAADMALDYESALVELRTEINRLTNAGLECAHGETMATDEAAEWVDLAALHDAKIKHLQAENQSHLETLYKFSTDMMGAEDKIADLTAKLEAANAELHDLRIKAGIGQPEPDWSQAPPGYRWWAIDADGSTHWYANEPHTNKGLGGWYDDEDSSLMDESSLVPGWESSLRQRPT
jgi:hypothetical protein